MGNVHNVYRINKGRMNKCISNVRGWGGAEKKSDFPRPDLVLTCVSVGSL